jgi:hypothetical protein
MITTCTVGLLAVVTSSHLTSAEDERPHAGMPAADWQRAGDAILLSDLSVCTPRSALSDHRAHGKWKVLEYETPSFAGRCVAAGPLTDAPPLTLPLSLSGWHAIYLGLAWHYYEQNLVRVKVTGDMAYQHRSHQATQEEIEEVFFKCADLTGKDLHFAQQSAGFAKACVIMYVKFVPLTAEEVVALQEDARQRGTKRLLATIDGHGYLYDRMPTTREELLEEFENYRDSDFGVIWYDGASAGIARYDPPAITDWVGLGYKQHYQSVQALRKKGISINRVAVEACHALGMKIHISTRPAGWITPVPFEDFANPFYLAHPEWRCRGRDGSPVNRMSYVVPEVREEVLRRFREAVEEAEPDGVNMLFNRGCGLVLWEEPFCRQFQERYGEDPREGPEEDPRVSELRGEIMTQFFREMRQMLDEVQEKKGRRRRFEISAMLLGTEVLNTRFGLSAERWVKEGLLDAIGVDWAAFDAGSTRDGGAYYDLEYYRRITAGTGVPVYPIFNPIEWASVGDPAAMSHGYRVGDVRGRTVGFYDEGAAGAGFWDVSGAVTDATLWPILSRLGHKGELRAQAGHPRPPRVTHRITRWDGIFYGGPNNPWASG